jgi:transposase
VPRQTEFVICDQSIERSFAWLHRNRRLRVRYERRADILQGLLHLACSLVCIRFLAPLP